MTIVAITNAATVNTATTTPVPTPDNNPGSAVTVTSKSAWVKTIAISTMSRNVRVSLAVQIGYNMLISPKYKYNK